jgi:hypothetical protein
MGSSFPTGMLVFEVFQMFYGGSDDGVVAQQAHALRNFLGVVTALEDRLGFFCLGHNGDSGQ